MARNPDQSSQFTALDLVPVTPSDSVDLLVNARAIRAQGAGTLRLTTISGNLRNTNIAAGEVLLVGASRIHAAGTTATGIEAMI